ncbi:MAG TPA: GNAT family N-acetyltransferase [Micromonosporaceae bacterium]|nr:GNAT family N-acetyltransferase [Micromonosporaceae bacterium]
MFHPEMYAANTVGMWSSLAPTIAAPDGALGVSAPGGSRYVIHRPLDTRAIAGLLGSLPTAGRVVVEDPYGAPPMPALEAMTTLRMPVMNRPPGSVTLVHRPDVTVIPVADTHTLADAERVIVEGFPLRYLQPWEPGQALPPQVLTLPAWRVWLACRYGEPAAAGYTYDDGVAVGVYFLATLPQHRFAGLGKAVMAAMLAAYPGRTATLVATEAGEPLYTRLGFSAVSTATWYVRAG